MRQDAGYFDRRIEVQIATETPDDSNDAVLTWSLAFKLWANKSDNRGREFFGAAQLVRDADTAFTVRNSSESRTIAPETHRLVVDGRVFGIVSISQGKERVDTLLLLATSRPDLRGSSAPEIPSGE